MTTSGPSGTMWLPDSFPCTFPPVLAAPCRHLSDQCLVDLWQELSAQVARVERHIARRIDQSGVSAQWFTVLHRLLRADDHQMPMSALAREVSMTSGGLTKLADRMVGAGLLGRCGSAGDRRVVNATLSAAGLRMAQQSLRTYQQALRECLPSGTSATLCGCHDPAGSTRYVECRSNHEAD